MGMPTDIVAEIYGRLERIRALAEEVETIPNFGPDVWSMKEGDKKCQQIKQDAEWIYHQVNRYVGTGHTY